MLQNTFLSGGAMSGSGKCGPLWWKGGIAWLTKSSFLLVHYPLSLSLSFSFFSLSATFGYHERREREGENMAFGIIMAAFRYCQPEWKEANVTYGISMVFGSFCFSLTSIIWNIFELVSYFKEKHCFFMSTLGKEDKIFNLLKLQHLMALKGISLFSNNPFAI